MAIQLQDPKTQKIILVSILGTALLYVYFLTSLFPFTFKAGAAEIKDLSNRYKSMSSDITKARQTLNSLPYLEKEYTLLHAKWQEAQSLLPDEQEAASFLRAVALLGDHCGVEFVLFRPLPAQAAQYYTEHPIELKVEGGYNEIGAFLGQLANMERIVTVSDLEIEGIKSDDAEKPASASFIAKTYTLGGTGVPAEAVAAAAAAAEKTDGKGTKPGKAPAGKPKATKTTGGANDE